MKKLLVLGLVLAMVAILVAPLAAFADGTTQVTASVATTSVSVTPPGVCDFGQFAEGWNGPAVGTTQGKVSFTQGTGTFNHWQLAVYSKNDGINDFSGGAMYCTALPRYLGNAMWISFASASDYLQLPVGLSYNGDSSSSYDYWIYAKQDITHADATAGAGAYFIVIYSEVTLVP